MDKYLLGIEYSKERVKCAVLKLENKKYQIIALQNFENSDLSNSLDALCKWKNETLQGEDAKAVISVSESLIFLKELKVPNASEKSVDEAIYWELSSDSPLPPASAIYEWTRLNDGEDGLNVVAMVIRESIIEEITNKLEENGIEVVAVEPSSVSLSRSAGKDYQKVTMLLMVGGKETDMVAMKEGIPVFSTTVEAILKRSKEKKWKLSKTASEKIAKSTEELITFWEEKSGDKIQQVLITGDLVDKYFGLAQRIHKFADVPVNIAKQNLRPEITFPGLPKVIVKRYLIAIGAVSRFLGEIYTGINLIPKEKKSQISKSLRENLKIERLKKIRKIFSYFCFLLLLVTVFFVTLLFSYNKTIKDTKSLIQNHEAQKYVEDVETTNNYLSKIISLEKLNRDNGSRLQLISEHTPVEIILTKIEYENSVDQIWDISGVGSREAVLSYYQELENELQAKAISMPYSNLDNDLENEFVINIIW